MALKPFAVSSLIPKSLSFGLPSTKAPLSVDAVYFTVSVKVQVCTIRSNCPVP